MMLGYASEDVASSADADGRLPRYVRVGLILVGLVLTVGAWPMAFVFAVFSGGGHGSPFDGDAVEFAMGVAILGVPFFVLLLGIACIACTNRCRLRIVGALAAAVPVTFVIAVLLMRAASRPHSHAELATPAPPIVNDASRAVAMPGGKHVSIACNAATGECVQREQELGKPYKHSADAIAGNE
jgi:hypothetical protein